MSNNIKSFFDELKTQFPNITATSECYSTHHQPDTLDQAREKVIAKLNLNKVYFENGCVVAKGSKKPDTVFKNQACEKIAIGIKYGNRWLTDIFGVNCKFVQGISKVDVPLIFDALIKATEEKQFDHAIRIVMRNNLVSKGGGGIE